MLLGVGKHSGMGSYGLSADCCSPVACIAPRLSLASAAAPAQANATCLADWHAVLHARHLAAHLQGQAGWAADPLPCRPAAAAALKLACLALAERCLPPPGEQGAAAREQAVALRRLHGLMEQHLCQAHTCDKRRKRSHLMAVAQARGANVE